MSEDFLGKGVGESDTQEVKAVVPQMEPQAPKKTLMGARDVFRAAWSLFGQKRTLLVGIMLLPTVTTCLLYLFAGKVIGGPAPVVILLSIAQIAVSLWAQAALLYGVTRSQEMSVAEAYREGGRRILSLSWIGILTVFIGAGGLLLFIVPGVVFFVWISLSSIILFAEEVKGMDALLKSREYVRGYWWAIFGRLLFFVVFYIVIGSILSILFAILHTPKTIAEALQGLLFTPLTAVYTFVLYTQLKELKGLGVAAPAGGLKKVFVLVGTIGIVLMFVTPVVLTSLNSARERTRDTMRVIDRSQLRLGLTLYSNDHGNAYPATLGELSPAYITTMPTDPVTAKPYMYQQTQGGTDYRLCADFEIATTSKCVSAAQ